MRKLRRCVENNKRRQARARRTMMALIATSVAFADAGALSVYAEGTPEVLQVTEVTNVVDEIEDENDIENEGNGEDGSGTDVENGEGDANDENGEGDTDDEDVKEIDKEVVRESRPLGSRMMLASSQNPSDTPLRILPEVGKIIDLDEVNIDSGKINVVIEKSGSYTLTGSNQRGGAYVDVSIIIEGGVVADLYFDDFHIVNDDFDYTETTSIVSADGRIVNPIVVNGTANVHVKTDSDIKAVTDFFEVNGTLNFVDSEEDAKLNCSLSRVMRIPMGQDSEYYFWLSNALIISKSGEVHFKDANVHFENSDMEGVCYSRLDLTDQYASPKVYLDGTRVSFGNNIKIAKMYTSLPNLNGCGFTVDKLYNSEGLRVYSKVVGGFPASSQILQIENFDGDKVLSMTRPADLYADDSGKIPASLVTNQMLFFVKTGDGVKVYSYYNNDGSGSRGASASSFYQPRLVTIKFVDSLGDEIESYYSLKTVQDSDGEYSSTHSLFFPEEDSRYVYTYKLGDGTPVTRDTMITGDMVIYVTKVEKGKIQVTIDDSNYTVDYGTPLSSAGGPSTQYYLNTVSKKLVKGEESITEEGSYKSINITSTTDASGKEWFELSNEEDLEEFAYIVNSGNGKINGRLNDDIHNIPSDFSMIGTVSEGALYPNESKNDINNHSYSGTFDGQNHTVNINNLENINRVNYGFATGLFGCVSSGAVIQNIILTGAVNGGKYTGALAGTTFGQSGNVTIKNCINHATVTGQGENACAGGLIGGNISSMFYQSDMTVEVVYCGNTGKVQGLNGVGFVGGLIGDSSKASVYSSFNSDNSNLLGRPHNCTISGSYSRMGSEDVVKSEEAFKSGEVAYLLNRAAGSNKWFQKCGIDNSPSLSGDVVYAGYTDCDDTEMSYSNTAFSHTEKGHKDKEEYSYSNGSIVAGCVYCNDELLATINCEAEGLSDHMKGVTVDYSEDWTDGNYPNIVIKYSTDEYGDYVAEVPQSVGDYYLKAYVGNSNHEVSISDTYSVKPVEKHNITNGTGRDDESINHGYITIDKDSVEPNETVTVTVYPSENYRLKSLPKYVLSGETYYASKGTKDNEYTFSMPDSDVTITAEFEQVIVPPSPTPTLAPTPTSAPTPKPVDPTEKFSDVPAGKWYSKPDGPVAYVVTNGIMKGTGDGSKFEPELPCTREMFVQILYNAEGASGAGPSNPFSDVKKGKWYYNAVTWALANDVTKGTSADEFGVGGNVTREQLAQLLMNYAKKRGYDITGRADVSKFPDAKEISSWAGNAVSWANANGIINGKIKDGVNVLDPKGNATRAEVAQTIMSFTKKFGR